MKEGTTALSKMVTTPPIQGKEQKLGTAQLPPQMIGEIS
jgi:hypothetical protein